MHLYTITLRNTTASGITLRDLAGLYIPASGTKDISELFSVTKLYESETLYDYITNSGIVVNVEGYDLAPTRAERFLSPHDATSIQGYPLGHNLGTTEIYTTPDKITVLRYDPVAQQASFSGIALTDLDDITIIGGNYYITNEYGDSPLIQDFTTLGDTPTTYSGYLGDLLMVGENGIIFANPLADIAYFRYEVDEDTTYSTSTTYVNKVTLTVSGIPPGIYRASWYYEYNFPVSNFALFTRVQMDDTTQLAEVAQRASSAADWFAASGFGYVTITGAYHHLDLDYRSDKTGTAAGIRRSRLELRRIQRNE